MVAQKVLQQQTYLSPEEYLAQEVPAKAKSEYLNGVTLLMAGASLNHNYLNQLKTMIGAKSLHSTAQFLLFRNISSLSKQACMLSNIRKPSKGNGF